MKYIRNGSAEELVENDAASNSDVEQETFPHASVSVTRYSDGMLCQTECNVICEREFDIVANGEPLVTLLCSGVDLDELAFGFLYDEGVINALSDVRSFTIGKTDISGETCRADVSHPTSQDHSTDDVPVTGSFDLDVAVRKPECPTVSSGFGGKVLYPPSFSAGTSGMRRVQGSIIGWKPNTASDGSYSIAGIMEATRKMQVLAREYAVTRGIHCSALFEHGRPVACFEDIGRHNTLDKLAGHCLLTGQDPRGMMLVTTGRVSGEMMHKALRLQVSGVVSLSGPTDSAISIARNAGILLAGYVRDSSMTVYVEKRHQQVLR